MEKSLVDSFANRLNSITIHTVKATTAHTPLFETNVLVCSSTSRIVQEGVDFHIEPVTETAPTYNPQIDVLFDSAASITEDVQILVVLLTGIGSDGAKGMLALRQKGAETIAESEESAIVYGMPRSACELGAAIKCLSLGAIIDEIIRFDSDYV